MTSNEEILRERKRLRENDGLDHELETTIETAKAVAKEQEVSPQHIENIRTDAFKDAYVDTPDKPRGTLKENNDTMTAVLSGMGVKGSIELQAAIGLLFDELWGDDPEGGAADLADYVSRREGMQNMRDRDGH